MSGPLATGFPLVIDSLEVRWFASGPIPPEAEAWFVALGPLGAVETRTDRYLIPTESGDLGLKIREGTVQAKQRRTSFGVRRFSPEASGAVEAWRKWTLGEAAVSPEAGWADVVKSRRQRVKRLVGSRHARCALELAELSVNGEPWWSVCLEASGESHASRWRALRASARTWLRTAPPLPATRAMGYPAWLRHLPD